MKKTITAAILIFISTSLASADALHRNPMQPGNQKNMLTFGRTSIPFGYYEYCKRFASRCAMKEKQQKLQLNRDNWYDIVSINNLVNREIKPVTDLENYGKEEFWTYPTQRGDCEDYALLKRKILHERGIPLSTLLLTVVYDANDGGHAVLTVVTDKGDFILDNQESKVFRWQEAELTYLKRQSQKDPNRWENLRRDG
jgi:predicted transglutaminase-like cysteine proteinase